MQIQLGTFNKINVEVKIWTKLRILTMITMLIILL